MKIKDLIKVKGNVSDLIRLGPNSDSGYVVNKTALESSNVLYCYGVGHNYDFELDFSKMFENKLVRMYDPTISDVCLDNSSNVFFYKEGLYGVSENNTTFEKHMEVNEELNKNVFLKIDVENYEYNFFKNLNFDYLKNVTGMVIEFHELQSDHMRSDFKSIVSKLIDLYDITHVHGNNHTPLLEFDGQFRFPSTPEISFIRKDLNNCEQYSERNYPLPNLDYPNHTGSPDFIFSV